MAPGKSTKVRAQRASRERGKPIPKPFCSRRKIQTGYDGYLAASTTPQWATHAHAAILRSTVATTTRATSASVPYPCWRTDGDPVNYCNFIRSFENLIEAKTKNSSTRLYYLMQHTFGDVQELMWCSTLLVMCKSSCEAVYQCSQKKVFRNHGSFWKQDMARTIKLLLPMSSALQMGLR